MDWIRTREGRDFAKKREATPLVGKCKMPIRNENHRGVCKIPKKREKKNSLAAY